MSDQAGNPVHLRRTDNSERFVAFAFAAAEMVAETDLAGVVTFAAGAFRSHFGRPPEECLGAHVRHLVSASDHEALEMALVMLAGRGRLLPLTIRLSNASRSQVALAGMRRTLEGQPNRLCLTFALLPAPVGQVMQASSANAFARAGEQRMRSGTAVDLALLEVSGSSMDAVGTALGTLAPDALTSELAPGRYGLLSDTSAASLEGLAASLETALREQGVTATVSSRNLSLTDGGISSTQAVRALRQALDTFARSGTHGLDAAGFTSGLAGYVKNAIQYSGAMRRAISQRKFGLMFQPIVQLSNRRLHHYEALLRPLPVPGCPADTAQEFVMLAETIGLAVELDLAVLNLVCEATARSRAPIAFNISGQSMQEPSFRDKLVARLLREPARKTGCLVAEMTETAQIENIPEAAKTAQLLRDLGIPFCLDDFGAGGADMQVLRKMPADIVKLDGSYIAGITTEGRERAFVAGMIEIARAAQADVVAEWIETEEEAALLTAMGVRFGQGWLFGRAAPLPVL